MSQGNVAGELSAEELVQYLVEEIKRAMDAYAARSDGALRVMALGQALALFNLADRFGLAPIVRERLRQATGADLYIVFSDAMRQVHGMPPGP